MLTIKTNRLMLLSGPKTKYFTTSFGGKTVRVPVRPEVAAEWDNITEVDIDSVHYDMGRDPEGDGTDKPSKDFAFDRVEIIGRATRGGLLADAKFDAEIDAIRKPLLKSTIVDSVEAAEALGTE